MLLRSSSTPVLGSLISESPNHHHLPEILHHPPTTTIPHSLNKLSFHRAGSQNFTFSCNSSPSVSEFSIGTPCSSNGFRRAQSEGNLEGLGNATSNVDEFSLSNPIKKLSSRSSGSFLETIPSLSFNNSKNRYEDEESEDEEEGEEKVGNENQLFNNSIRSDMEKKRSLGLNQDMSCTNVYANTQMYLARGLGISGLDISFGGGDGHYSGNGGCGGGCSGAGDGQERDPEEHYKRMVQENPGNPLFLRNYAQFLFQTKQDLQGAEEYYSRAILIDPKDGEILSQYAKLVWELHHDIDRATGYFQRAVQAASEDSYVHAAYASFLWEIEDEEEEEDNLYDAGVLPPLLHRGAMASAATA